ncbi:MAG: hypothetical protein LQ351_002581 [Letrouitia transgressa]|nr:MAG: hypothetical protein LQ351_002581 [Letrouitia transgressa]
MSLSKILRSGQACFAYSRELPKQSAEDGVDPQHRPVFVAVSSAVQPIKVQGADYVNSVSGDRFQIIGVAYQPGGSSGFTSGGTSDPLSDGDSCLRDAALMQRLGINTIRVYNLNPTLDHDLCASIFNAVGIHMLLDVNSPLPNESLNPQDLASSYNTAYLTRTFAVVEAFKNFPNTLGFFSGNEVMQTVPDGGTVPQYVRAVTRDLKKYIAKNCDRNIPVGYSAADVRDILADSFAYLSCDNGGSSDDQSRIDFFGLNSYSWCGKSDFKAAGYDILISMFSNTTIPVFFSEYGCNEVRPRVFDEVQALYGPQMTSVMSGGIIYEYVQEPANNFGLVNLFGNGTASLRDDYDSLQKQYNKLDVKALESGNSSATKLTSPACSSKLISEQSFSRNFSVPSSPPGTQSLIDNGIKDPNSGRLVPVTNTAVKDPVYSSNGGVIKNLAIKPLPDDQSNTPNGQDTSGSASVAPSGTSTGAKPSKTSAAEQTAADVLGLVVALTILMLWSA